MIRREAEPSFTWGWTVDPPPIFEECSTIGISINDSQVFDNPLAASPFYMIAYPSGGVPSVSLIGNDKQNLTWVVPFPSGTSFLMQVVDSNGNSGGIGQVYNVTDGPSTSCHNSTTSSPISIITETTPLSTCDTLSLHMIGGTPPYKLTFVQQGAPNPSNITLQSSTSTYYHWVDNLNPAAGGNNNTNLVVAAIDSTGQYSVATPFIYLQGSHNAICSQTPFESSSSTNQSTFTAPPQSTPSKSPTFIGTAIGATILIVIIVIACLIAFLRSRRRRRRQRFSMLDNESTSSHERLPNRRSYPTLEPYLTEPFIPPSETISLQKNRGKYDPSESTTRETFASSSTASSSRRSNSVTEATSFLMSSDGVIQHRDGGPAEIPPTYEDHLKSMR